jgi:hypothetical protein
MFWFQNAATGAPRLTIVCRRQRSHTAGEPAAAKSCPIAVQPFLLTSEDVKSWVSRMLRRVAGHNDAEALGIANFPDILSKVKLTVQQYLAPRQFPGQFPCRPAPVVGPKRIQRCGTSTTQYSRYLTPKPVPGLETISHMQKPLTYGSVFNHRPSTL